MRECICIKCGSAFYEDDRNPAIHYSNPSKECGKCSSETTYSAETANSLLFRKYELQNELIDIDRKLYKLGIEQ